MSDEPRGADAATEMLVREVRSLLDVARLWASVRRDVRALALVGSWARGGVRTSSDVDLVLLTSRVEFYAEEDDWVRELGGRSIVRTQAWGPVIERRVRMPSGLEAEFGVAPPYWAAVCPVDAGTRRVVENGMRVLHDPDGLLTALLRVVQQAPSYN